MAVLRRRPDSARTADGAQFADAWALLRAAPRPDPPHGENTTIGVDATNATLDKAQLALVARMAHDGLERGATGPYAVRQ